jgi:ABC-type transport system involved in multi-copper enzyme maturation permease subunit
MTELSKIAHKETSFSEAAVDGLFAGLLAGLVMAAYLAVTALLRSETPAILFSRFYPAQGSSPWTGFLMHLAVSSVYGIVLGLVWYLASSQRSFASSPWQVMTLGAGYGAGLFILAWYVLLPASASPLRQLPFWDLGLAHLVYGVALGYLVYRRSLEG